MIPPLTHGHHLANYADQVEIDYGWAALSEGRAEGPCGWLMDRFAPVVASFLTADVQVVFR